MVFFWIYINLDALMRFHLYDQNSSYNTCFCTAMIPATDFGAIKYGIVDDLQIPLLLQQEAQEKQVWNLLLLVLFPMYDVR